jgi:hypothetical protein
MSKATRQEDIRMGRAIRQIWEAAAHFPEPVTLRMGYPRRGGCEAALVYETFEYREDFVGDGSSFPAALEVLLDKVRRVS